MPADDAKIRMDGDTTPARAALQQVVDELRKMEGAMTRMANKSSKDANKVNKELMGIGASAKSAIKGIAGFIGVTSMFAGAYRAAALFRSELEAVKRIDAQAAVKNVTTAQAVEALRTKIGADPAIDFDDFRRRAVAASSDILTPEVIIATAADTVSAGATPEKKAVRAEIPLALATLGGKGLGADGFQSLAASLGTLSDNIENFDVDSATTMALQALNYSPAADIATFGKNILRGSVPELVNQHGFSLERAMQLSGASQVTTQDVEGARTRTNMSKQIEQAKTAARAYGYDLQGDELLDFIRGDSSDAKEIRHELLRSANREGMDAARKLKAAMDAGDELGAEQIRSDSAGVAPALLALLNEKNFTKLKPQIEGESANRAAGVDMFQALTVEATKGSFRENMESAKRAIQGGPEAVAAMREMAGSNRYSSETREATLSAMFANAVNVQTDADRSGGIRGVVLPGLRAMKESGRFGTELGRNIDSAIGQVGLLGASEEDILKFTQDAVSKMLLDTTTEMAPVPMIGSGFGMERQGGVPMARRQKPVLTESEQSQAEMLIEMRDTLRTLGVKAQQEQEARMEKIKNATSETMTESGAVGPANPIVAAIDRQTKVLAPSRPPNYKAGIAAMPAASTTSAE